MTTYITNITSDKLKGLLIGLKKEDTLIIFHSAEEKQIPIDMISLFSNAKGEVRFEEMPDELGLAFEIGRLFAETAGKPRASMEIQGDAPIFDRLVELIKGRKAPAVNKKPQQKKEAAPKPAASKEAVKKDDSAFDDAFEKFTGLIEGMKTDKYDPSGCKHGVLLAVRAINEDPSLTFEKVLPTTTTAANSKKFLANISKKNIDKLIASAREVLKYDS